MKKLFILILTIIFFLSFAATSSYAGSKQRHRWQGVAIGVGAALLGNAILNSCRDYSPPERHVVYEKRSSCYPCKPRPKRGHWEYRETWVPPVCERVWNPGHYSKCGKWVPGEWITIEKSAGYWKKERIWVCRR
jgi:hypothetical protein